MGTTAIARRVGSLEASAPLMRIVPAEATTPLPVEHPSDLLAVLAEQINAVRAYAHADPIECARTVGMLAGAALRAIEAKDLAQRLEAVERVLKLRKDQAREKERKEKGRRGWV
jgi:hypothetical protein